MKIELGELDEIYDAFAALASGDFEREISISEEGNAKDSILYSIKMLGEELENKTVSSDFFQGIYDAISDVVLVVDQMGKLKRVNTSAIKIFGLDNLLPGTSIIDLFTSEKVLLVLKDILKGNRKEGSFEDSLIPNFQEGQFYFSGKITRINSDFERHKGFLIILKDVTVEKNTETKVIEAIISTEERERRRIATDLHDALGQKLHGIKMLCESMVVMKKDSNNFDSTLAVCLDFIDNCIDTTHKLSHGIMPKAIEDGALFSAFEELERFFSELVKIEIFAPEEEFNISVERKINIYRVVQEFITNSLRHGKSETVQIKAFQNEGVYNFVISDNGIGFELENVKLGRGIRNMESRLKAIDARYSLLGKKGEGAELRFSFT